MKKKILAACLVICLLATAVIGGTLAYFTDTKTVTNSFTVGKVAITMDETDVDSYGVKDGLNRVTENSYKLIPGHEYTKDPIIHVASDSEDCYLFVKLENQIALIEDEASKVTAQMAEYGWVQLNESNIYYLEKFVDVSEDDLDIHVFDNFKVAGTVTAQTLADYNTKTIKLTAYAVQADGFETAAEAWAAAQGDLGLGA